MADSNSWGRSSRQYDWGESNSEVAGAGMDRSHGPGSAEQGRNAWGQGVADNANDSSKQGQSDTGAHETQEPDHSHTEGYGWEKQEEATTGWESYRKDSAVPRETEQAYPETTTFPPVSAGNRPVAQEFPTQYAAQFNASSSDYPTSADPASAFNPPAAGVAPRTKGTPVIIAAVVLAVALVAGGISWAAISAHQDSSNADNVAESVDNDKKVSSAPQSEADDAKAEEQERDDPEAKGSEDEPEQQAEQKTLEAQASAGEHCGPNDAVTASEIGLSYIEPYRGNNWSVVEDGYDRCASLSWQLITLERATVASPYHIMLFNHGKFLGTATYEPYGYPRISRVDDYEIAVTFTWPREGEGNANPQGRTNAWFRWDEAQGKVVMTGDVPPY
ncbi:LppP/LprE family lipoprotein [Corynebacterium sp. MNWGS58]|uniref:LppP/LprE family lipoprotein n=1 Tax=Corynebacterium sp. 102791.4 TaxID=3104612 RepID=UPI0035164119